jgi:hypothetical protein
MHQIIMGDRLYRLPGLAPRPKPADYHERIEPLLPQHVRHPGAGRFARSSAVHVNVFVAKQRFHFFRKIIGINAD